MEEVLKPDLCVIGAGSGGLSVAAAAAQFGVPVVLIEKGRMGGDCLNYGCVPSKALLAAGKRAEAVRTASNFGIDVIEAQIDHRGVHDHVHGVIAAIAPNDSIERMTGLGVRVIQASASFLDKFTVEAGRVLVRARRFVIATGSTPLIPPIPGLDEVPYFTNETIFDVSERIQHLIVLGGGPIGLELGQAHRMLGSHVTIFDTASLLANEDPEASRVLIKKLQDTEVVLHPNTRVERIERSVQGVAVHFHKDGETTIIKGTHLLVATGRKPNLKSLSLERAEIAYTDEGIKVNEQLKTSNRRIYAVGDVIGGPKYTHLANYHAGIVIRNALFRLKPDVSAATIPRVVYTDPELAQIGLTEEEAHKRFRRRSHPHLSLALCRQRPRPMRARDGRVHQGHHPARRHHSRLHHRRRACRRAAPALGGRHGQGHQARRHHLVRAALSDPVRALQARRLHLLSTHPGQGLGPPHHRPPAPLRLTVGPAISLSST